MIHFSNYYGKSKNHNSSIFYFYDDSTREEFKAEISSGGIVVITKNDESYIKSKDNVLVREKKKRKIDLIEKMVVDLSISINMIELDHNNNNGV
jgi:hypothetical protein